MSLNYFFSFLVYLKVKDLKRQLKLERKRAEQLQQKLQEALSENRVKPGMFFLFLLREPLLMYQTRVKRNVGVRV